jgi:site-specific recombinase XerD
MNRSGVTSVTIAVDDAHSVRGLLLAPPSARACYVLAHGAGAGMFHPFMDGAAKGLAERGIATLRYQFPYMERGAKRPDPPELAHATVLAAVAEATAERLLAMAANTGAGLKGLRDRALLLIGFAGALRRSELVALNIEDIEGAPDGMKITIRHSKTDQEGAGQTIAIPFGKIACPVAALKDWITAAGIGSGALFRRVNRHGKVGERLTDQSVSDIVKEHAERLRLNPKQFAGHSLRAGFLTSAASRGASIFKMMDVSRHRSVDTLRGYVRDAELFKDHAGAGLL